MAIDTCTTTVPILPRTADHGDEVCDKYGNQWFYDAGQDGWVSKGTVTSPSNVSESDDGLVSADIFNKLRKLREFIKTGFDFSSLKILPGRDAYWYYFRSSDKMFRFKPESDSALRIEVDKSRIFQLLLKETCPGSRGPTGNRGDQGLNGDAGADEPCFTPSAVSSNRLDFAIFTPTPLLNSDLVLLPNDHVPEISVRLFTVSTEPTAVESQLQHLAVMFQSGVRKDIATQFQATREILQNKSLGVRAQEENLCDISMSPVATITSGLSDAPIVTIEISPDGSTDTTVTSSLSIDIERTTASLQFDVETNIVCGSIFLQTDEWGDVSNDWCVKSRQKGPDGIRGDPGECRFKIVECLIDDTNVLANCPIINTRLDCELDVIYTICADLVEEVCADSVSLLPDSGTLTDSGALKSTFASAQMSLEECKFIHRFNVTLEEDDIPELELLHWEPQPGCVTRRSYNRHKFNWIPQSNLVKCDIDTTWYSPVGLRTGRYPYDIHRASIPPADECCQDDFFYCPNVQDAPCEGEPPKV